MLLEDGIGGPLGATAGTDDAPAAGDAAGTAEAGPYGAGVGETGDSSCNAGKPWANRKRAEWASFDVG